MGARKRLKSIEDVRRYIAGLINRAEAGQVEPGLAGKLGYLSSILVRILESTDLERRIEALEAKMEGQRK